LTVTTNIAIAGAILPPIALAAGQFGCAAFVRAGSIALAAAGVHGRIVGVGPTVPFHPNNQLRVNNGLLAPPLANGVLSQTGIHVALLLSVGGQEIIFDNNWPWGIARRYWLANIMTGWG